ncbi:hypothetical protein N9A67_03470 [Rhodobacteraceae bacterium]|nr:hypothetical protein [Paracoccaceae bacterium]
MTAPVLHPIAQAKYERQKFIFAQLKQRESQLLDALETLNRPTTLDWKLWHANHELVWHRWADQQRSALSTQLAQCLAAQHEHRPKVCKSFAQVTALSQIAMEEDRARHAKARSRQQDVIERFAMLSSINPDAQCR